MTEKNSKQARPGNQNRLVHGGRAAENCITYNREFSSVALSEMKRVEEEYQARGAIGMVELNAEREQVVSNLFWEALLGASDLEDKKLFLTYADKFATHTNNASRHFLSVHEARRGQEENEPIDLSAYREEVKEDASNH